MQTLTEIRQLLADRGLRPRHRLGQNFLHDKNQLERLLKEAGLRPGDLVLEVGPGTGTLTEALLERGMEVVACELDPAMADIVIERAGGNPNLNLVRGDCLEKQRRLNPQIAKSLGARPFKLVANLPYQVASPLIGALLMDSPKCGGLFVTIQKEVAERLTAKPVTKQYGPLSIIVQALAEVELIGTLSPSCFWPPPEVTSAMVAIHPHLARGMPRAIWSDHIDATNARDFAKFITDLFTKRRKQLGTTFGRDRADWPKGVTPDQRPEELTVEQMITLWRSGAKPRRA